MKHAFCKGRALAVILATLAAAASATAGAAEPPALVNGIRVDGAELGEWTHDWEAATAAAKAGGKPVFVNFTGSDWCGWCMLLKRQVFTQPEWTDWARRHVFLVHVDFPNDKALVPEKYRERNLDLARRYQIRGYPTCLLLDPATLEPIGRFGASRDVDAAGFAAQVASAIPGAAKPAAPSKPAAPPKPARKAKKPLHPYYPEKRRIGKSPEPGFEIRNGTLLGMKSQDAEDVVVPDGVKTVCIDGLVSVRMKTLTVPEGVERISRRSGGYVPGALLEKLKLPASLEKIDSGALDGHWRNLKAVKIAAGSPYRMQDGFLVDTRDGSLVFALPGRRISLVPSGVKTIGDWAFNANDASKIVIPEGVEKIGRGAFGECRSLERISIPASVREIGADAFGNCGKLAHVAVAPDNPRYAARDGLLLDVKTATLLRAFGPVARVTIPPEVRIIGENAFSFMDSLVSVTVPATVRRIENGAFAHCKNLKELLLPERLDFYDSHFIMGCAKLREIRLPAGLVSIGGNFSFGRCSALRELVLPEGVRTIGGGGLGAVCECENLERICIPASVTQIASGAAFAKNPKLKAFDVHPGNPAFRSEDGVLFSRDMTRLVRCPETKKGNYDIPDSVRRIDACAFADCRGLRKIRIPDGVASAGYGAFKDCPAELNRTVPVAPDPVAVPAPLPRVAPPTVDAPGGNGEGSDAGGSEDPALPTDSFPVDGVVAGFTFDSEDKADDSAKPGRAFKTVHGRPVDAFLEDGILRMDGEYRYGEMPQLVVPELRYDRFTVAMDFRPQAEPGRPTPLLSFGGGWRWFHVLLRADGTPVVAFRGLADGDFAVPLSAKFSPGKWNWLAAAFDAAERRLSVVLNGRRLPDIALPDDFAFRFDRDDRAQSRTVQFANLNNGTAYKGEIAGFLLFDRALADAELDAIAAGRPAPPPPDSPPASPEPPAAAVSPERWTFAPDGEAAALYWNGTVSDGAVTLDARLADGEASVSFPFHVAAPGGVLDLRKPFVAADGREVPLVGIGPARDESHVGCAGHRRDAAEILLPETLRYIGPGSFEDFAALARIDCPDSLRRIGSAAFSGCRSLRSFRVGPLVEAFSDDRVFMGCEALESIETDPANRFFRTVDGALLSADGSRLVAFPPGRKGAFAVPPGVEEIPARAFLGCKELTAVSIPASVGRIGPYAFAECPALERIDFENRAFALDDRVFGSDAGRPDFRRPATNLGNE